MAIPWVTTLHLVKKLLPVVIEKAPDFLRTFERFRTGPLSPEAASPDPTLAALHEQIETQQRTIATQADTIAQLRTAANATKRSLTVARTMLAVVMLLSLTIILFLLSRNRGSAGVFVGEVASLNQLDEL